MRRPAAIDSRKVGARCRRIAVPGFWLLTAAPLALLAGLPALGQEAADSNELDRVLAMHNEARGGLEALRAVQTMRARATLRMQGMEAPFTVLSRRPNQLRIDAEFGPGMALIQAYDGQQAWAQQPGDPKPSTLDGAEAAAVAAEAAMNTPWFEFQEDGYQVELAGREQIAGGEAWKLVVTTPQGSVQQVFIDVADGLMKRRVADADFGFGVQESVTTYEDFREVDGLVIAHRHTATSPMGELPLVFESFELNPEIDPDVFFLPGQAADASLGLDDVLARHLEARGGGDAAEVETVSGSGTIVFLGFEVPMTVKFARPGAFRIDIDLQGLAMILAYDGETAWNVSPMQGITLPTPLPAETAAGAAILADFLWGMLANRDANGLEVTLAGIDKVDRDETYRLDLTTAEGESRILQVGGEDFLERQFAFDGAFLGSAGRIEVTLADYLDVGGLQVPGTIRIAVDGQVAAELRIQEAEAGVEFAPGSFSMPAPPEPEAAGDPAA